MGQVLQFQAEEFLQNWDFYEKLDHRKNINLNFTNMGYETYNIFYIYFSHKQYWTRVRVQLTPNKNTYKDEKK